MAALACARAADDRLPALEARLGAVEHQATALRQDLDALRARPAPPPVSRGPDPMKVYSVPVSGAPARGPKDAWVTVVAFADFQCKFCGDAALVVDQVLAAYPKDVRLAFRHNPLAFHARALPAALAATCADLEGRFWPVYDALFANTRRQAGRDPRELARGAGMEDEALAALVVGAGGAADRLRRCVASPATRARVHDDQALALRLGARGTPAFFINGRYLGGAQPLARFRALIDEELARAQDSGTPRAAYYERAVVAAGERALAP